MSTLTAVPVQQITPAPVVPVNLDQSSARVHACRVSDLMREVSAATRIAESREREGFADLLALGIALSQAVDLGIIGAPGGINWREVWPHAFPTGRTKRFGGCRFREAIRLDTPRYHAEHKTSCPVPGPRGGACHAPRTRSTKWVTNLQTGAYEYREICPAHQQVAFQRHLDAPAPATNRGGILAAVFAEYDMGATYRYVNPKWEPQVGLPDAIPMGRPKLEMVVGGLS